MTLPSRRLIERGITLPQVPAPLAAYVPAVRFGDLVFTSGQLPLVNGALVSTGKVGAGVTVEEAAQAARAAALNAVAAAASMAGDIDAIVRVLKLVVYVASAPDFIQQAQVGNGASGVIAEIFGDGGRHARSAVGVATLPMDACVEVELVVGVGSTPTIRPL